MPARIENMRELIGRRKEWFMVAGVAVASLAIVSYRCFSSGDARPSQEPQAAEGTASLGAADNLAEMRKVVASHMRRKGKTTRKRISIPKDMLDRSMFGRLSESDRKLCEAVQEALDANDAERTIAAAIQLMSSTDPEARSHAVDALGWFGVEALPELTALMGDANEDVAQNAINSWESGLSEIEEPSTRLKLSDMAMNALESKDALESIGAQFSVAATEYMDEDGTDEEVSNRRVEVLQSLVNMIGSPNKRLSDVGHELYEEITGYEWISVSEAELYLRDPDNYEPPGEDPIYSSGSSGS
jgi:hypothetical protein